MLSIRSVPFGGLTVAAIVAGALVFPLSSAATAATQVTVVGGAAVPTHAPSTDEVTYTISVGDASAGGVVLNAHQPAGTIASPVGVEVDGSRARPGTVDQVGNGLRIRLGSGADSAHGGTLGVGNHTVSFDTDVTSLPGGSAAAYSVVDYAAGARTRHVTSPRIPLALPDIALTKPSGSGEKRVLPLGTGVDADFEAILSNSGGGAPSASLTISLPVGMRIDRGFGVYRDDQYRSEVDPGGAKLGCSTVASHMVRCVLGAVPAGTSALLDIPVQPTSAAHVGKVGTFRVAAVSDNGLEATRADNAVRGSVRYSGTAHLVVTIAPHTRRVPVGHTGRLIVSAHNAGPDPALRALGLVAVHGVHFTITRLRGVPIASAASSIRALARRGWGARSGTRSPATAATAGGKPLVLWRAGTIRSGRTARAIVTVKARSAGRDELLVGTGSSAGDPPCAGVNPTPRCKSFAFARLIASRPARHRPASHSVTPVPTAAAHHNRPVPGLADTGPRDADRVAAAGGLAIASGMLLLVLGSVRPRRARARTH